MKETTLEIAGLTVRSFKPEGTDPKLAVILCHGFGAPGTDLVPIGRELAQASPQIGAAVQFVFPEAPLSLGGFPPFESRAWWMIDTAALEAAMMRGELLDRRNDVPSELPALRSQMDEILAWLEKDSGLALPDVVLGGFSQGAMLSTDVALHLSANPRALCIFSGTLLCESVWKERAAARSGLRVVQSHGRQDPLLPFAASELLRDLLSDSGLEVEFIPFEGPHTIPMEAMIAFKNLLENELVPSR